MKKRSDPWAEERTRFGYGKKPSLQDIAEGAVRKNLLCLPRR